MRLYLAFEIFFNQLGNPAKITVIDFLGFLAFGAYKMMMVFIRHRAKRII
jgi:hypothetical protein